MLHINRFIDNVKAHESRAQRDLVMTIKDARDLHADITKLLLALQVMQEKLSAQSNETATVNIEVQGGSF